MELETTLLNATMIAEMWRYLYFKRELRMAEILFAQLCTHKVDDVLSLIPRIP